MAVTAPSAAPVSDRPGDQPHRFAWEVAGALAAFAVLCAVALATPARLVEPDDYAYRAAIVALAHGHLMLSTAQYEALRAHLAALDGGGVGIAQWSRHAGGFWMSEKNPGYPFFAVPFYALGIMRLAPLFYGGLACAGLFAGGRRWLGRWGGTVAVALYCTSGAAMLFAWRDTMPTFTDASLVAAGTGSLLWAVLATEARPRRRVVAGLLAFLAFEGATFIRYSDVLVLAVGALVVVVLAWRAPGWLPRRAVPVWLGSVAVFGAGLAVFDAVFYGGPLATGYRSGVITFSLDAVAGNLRTMPAHLVVAMPFLVVALAGAVGIAARAVLGRRRTGAERGDRRDLAVGGALAVSWAAAWGFYAAYNWTADLRGGSTLQLVRFYLPALGAMALLGAWALVRLPRWAAVAVLVVLVGLGSWSAGSMRSSRIGGGGPPPGAGVPAITGRGGLGAPGAPGGRLPPPGGPGGK